MDASKRAERLIAKWGLTDSDPDGWDKAFRNALIAALRAERNATVEDIRRVMLAAAAIAEPERARQIRRDARILDGFKQRRAPRARKGKGK